MRFGMRTFEISSEYDTKAERDDVRKGAQRIGFGIYFLMSEPLSQNVLTVDIVGGSSMGNNLGTGKEMFATRNGIARISSRVADVWELCSCKLHAN